MQFLNMSLWCDLMDDNERLKLMKQRIIRSFKWHKDIVVPLADYFGISIEEMEDILMDDLDMSSLECLHTTHEQAEWLCLKKRIHADLRLCWLSGTLNLVTDKEAKELTDAIADEVWNGKDYDEAIKQGKDKILQILKDYNLSEKVPC